MKPWGIILNKFSPFGRIQQVQNTTSSYNFGTTNINSVRISTVPGGTVQPKIFSTNKKGLGTDSNLLLNARWNLHFSCTGDQATKTWTDKGWESARQIKRERARDNTRESTREGGKVGEREHRDSDRDRHTVQGRQSGVSSEKTFQLSFSRKHGFAPISRQKNGIWQRVVRHVCLAGWLRVCNLGWF